LLIVSAALAVPKLRFPLGAETRRLDADGRIKIAWTTPEPVRLSDLLGWGRGALDVIMIDGWMLLTQPECLAGVKPARFASNAVFTSSASGAERISLKPAHINQLAIADMRTVLVAPVPAFGALMLVSPVTCLGSAPAHVADVLSGNRPPSSQPLGTSNFEASPTKNVTQRHLSIIKTTSKENHDQQH
jgi:hypothetical protein